MEQIIKNLQSQNEESSKELIIEFFDEYKLQEKFQQFLKSKKNEKEYLAYLDDLTKFED